MATLIEKKARTEKVLIAIDGRCASGKSTLAENLSKIFGCDIIHMDDFFLPFEKRTPERLAEPGGNIDYERFEKEVLNSFHKNEVFSYGVFNCGSGKIEAERVITPSNIIITEGSYSLHPKFSDHYNLKIFVSTDSNTQIKRIRERNGEEMLKMFKERWIPMEENYFTAFDIGNLADIKLNT
ncbi:MAG: uridine kinase [Clostridia bacterium]|nr:uridine kinase [Clostridia bacterium]